jgi:WhiB family redox-sensing transcriptional regulator
MHLSLAIDIPQWTADAACIGMDPEAWFPERGNHGSAARRVCDNCPVRCQCADFGRDEKHGIWGGITAAARLAAGFGKGRPGIDYDFQEIYA